jgi:hypothetical protein
VVGLLWLVAVRALFEMGQGQGLMAAAIALPGV